MDLSRGASSRPAAHRRAGDVITDEKILVASSVDNSASCRTSSTSTPCRCRRRSSWRAAPSRWRDPALRRRARDQRHPRTGGTPPRAASRARARLDHHRRLRMKRSSHRRYNMQALPVRRAAPGARGRCASWASPRGIPPVEACGSHGRPRRDPQHWPVLYALRRHRGHGRGSRGVFPNGAVTRIKNVPRRAAGRHPPRRHRNEGAVLHHRGHGQALPYFPRTTSFGLHAERT